MYRQRESREWVGRGGWGIVCAWTFACSPIQSAMVSGGQSDGGTATSTMTDGATTATRSSTGDGSGLDSGAATLVALVTSQGTGTGASDDTTGQSSGTISGATSATDTGEANDSVLLYFGFTSDGEFNDTPPVRESINARCQLSADTFFPEANCGEAVAVISLGEQDTVAGLEQFGMPFDRPVLGPNGLQLKVSFVAALISMSLDRTLSEAGVDSEVPARILPAQHYWTGSESNGTLATATCEGWSTNDSSFRGVAGLANTTDGQWITALDFMPVCGLVLPVLCACW